jgi:hypothetical protein
MRKKLGHATAGHDTAGFIAASQLRFSILEEERLRRSIAADEETRRTHPDAWRAGEASRRAENREIAEMNRRLRALGLEPVSLEPSLAQRRQNLQLLERRVAAEIAIFRRRSGKNRPKPGGTRLARRRSGRSDD